MTAEEFGELDDIDFLREAALFEDMPDSVIRTIITQGRTGEYEAGELVVRKGTPGDSLFVVKTGVVEVVNPADGPPLAYLGRGDSFGEMALLTNAERSADVRVPQQAELLVIDKELFTELMTDHVGFGSQLAVILAHRLVGVLEDLPEEETKKELEGDLKYFDLATVVQTLIGSSQSGVMTLSNGKEMVAQLDFQNGNVFRAHYEHRRGDEAFHHLFQAPPDGKFHFQSKNAEGEEGPDPTITVPAMALMMESVRLQDELKILLEDLPADRTLLERNTETFSWSEEHDEDDARELWTCLSSPLTVHELLERAHTCHFHSARLIALLIQTEQITIGGM